MCIKTNNNYDKFIVDHKNFHLFLYDYGLTCFEKEWSKKFCNIEIKSLMSFDGSVTKLGRVALSEQVLYVDFP